MLRSLPIILPSVSVQENILKTNQEIMNLETQIDAVKQKMQKMPAAYKEISKSLKTINNEETIDDWIEKIPYPIAVILRRYRTAADKDIIEKHDALRHFFEALSEFISSIFLSITNKAPNLPFDIYKNDDIKSYFEHPTFGSWVNLNKQYAKFFRDMLSNSREYTCNIFVSNNSTYIESLCNKELHKYLERAKDIRNKKDHGGVLDIPHYKLNLNTLEELLQEVKKILNDAFEDIVLIKSIQTEYQSGMFANMVEYLMGSNPKFDKLELDESIYPLDVGDIYFYNKKTKLSIKLEPQLFVMGETPTSERSACYFYNGTDNESTKYVSYHYENNPERQDDGDRVLSKLKDVLGDRFEK
jgi:hypothetical protein